MKRLLILFFVILSLFFLCAVFVGGLHYIKYVAYLLVSPKETRQAMWNALGENEYGQVGFYGSYFRGPVNRLLVWTRSGIKLIRISQNTIVSFYDGCNSDVLYSELSNGVSFKIDRRFYRSVDDFLISNKKAFGFVVNIGMPVDVKSNEAFARELWIYNWWEFIDGSMKTKCNL